MILDLPSVWSFFEILVLLKKHHSPWRHFDLHLNYCGPLFRNTVVLRSCIVCVTIVWNTGNICQVTFSPIFNCYDNHMCSVAFCFLFLYICSHMFVILWTILDLILHDNLIVYKSFTKELSWFISWRNVADKSRFWTGIIS